MSKQEEEIDWEYSHKQLELRFVTLQKHFEQLKEIKENLYQKQQELIKDHKSLLDKYYRS